MSRRNRFPHFNPEKYDIQVKIASVRTSAHSKHNINYHIVWIPKYRKMVLKGKVRDILKEIIEGNCQDLHLEMLALEIMPDHICTTESFIVQDLEPIQMYCPICCQKTTHKITWVSVYCTNCRREHGPDYTWSDIVRQRRLYLALTPREIAKLLNFKKETIYFYERKQPSKRYIELTEKLVNQMKPTIEERESM